VLSEQFARKLGIEILRIEKGDITVMVTADGNPIHVVGKSLLSIKLGGLTVPFEFLVVRRLSQNLILGIDFLKHTKAVINCSDKTISFYDDMVQVNILSHDRKIVACLDREYKLEPRTENVVQVYLSDSVPQQCIMMEPLIAREKQKYLIARALVEPRGKTSICRILNPTNQILKKILNSTKRFTCCMHSISRY